ncbi:MAG: hypothetical protein EBR82_59135 [Caulobacteraceae bacterium]|nr:hypothetical protein [Caulobacteraceae bacterium]
MTQARTDANSPKGKAQDLANSLKKPINDNGKIYYPSGYSANQYGAVNDYLQSQIDAQNAQKTSLQSQLAALHGQMKKAPISIINNFQGGYTGTKAQVAQEAALQKQIAAIGGTSIFSSALGNNTNYTGTLGTLLLTTQLQEDFLSNVADINPLNTSRTAAQNELNTLVAEQNSIKAIPSSKRTQAQKDRLSALPGEITKKQTTLGDLTTQIEFITGQTDYQSKIKQSTDLQKQIDPIVEQINALPKKGSAGYTPEVAAKLTELNNQLKPLQTQSKELVKSISGLRDDLLENQNKTISLVVTGEKKANAAEYNTEKARLAAAGYQDLRLSNSRPLTPEELEQLPYSKEMGFTAKNWQSMIADGYTPPSAPSGQIYSNVTSIPKDSPYYEAGQKVNADVEQALKFAEKYNLTQRYKSGDTTVGFDLNSLSKLSDAINDKTLSGWERQMAGKVASTMYNKVGGFFDRKDLTPEEIGFKLTPVLGSDKMFSAKTKSEDTGGHTAYFIKNDNGTYSFAGANWSYTPQDDGFLGGLGGIILGIGAAPAWQPAVQP